MKITKVICDRCGKEIEKDPIHIFFEFVDSATGDIRSDCFEKEFAKNQDFCEDCARQIADFAKTKNIEESNEKESNAKPEEKSEKIDLGKLFALKRAGWKIADIAIELRTTKSIINNALYRNKEEYQNFLNEQ